MICAVVVDVSPCYCYYWVLWMQWWDLSLPSGLDPASEVCIKKIVVQRHKSDRNVILLCKRTLNFRGTFTCNLQRTRSSHRSTQPTNKRKEVKPQHNTLDNDLGVCTMSKDDELHPMVVTFATTVDVAVAAAAAAGALFRRVGLCRYHHHHHCDRLSSDRS